MDLPEHAINGKVCLITGGNSGIGKATAVGMASLGGNVVIVARNREKGAAAIAEVKARSMNQDTDLMLADLSSMKSVKDFADEFKRKYDRLDILVNNAGEFLTRRHLTVDGLERTFASNHLGHFLLTRLLLDFVKNSAPSRIINVSSEAHRGARINFEDLQGVKKYRGFRAYAQSKLANVLFTYELAKRLEGQGVTVNCLHPGVVRTGFGHDDGGLTSLAIWIASPFFISSKKAAKAVVRLATSPELEGVSGKYFSRMKQARSSEESYDTGAAQRLWEVNEELTGKSVS